MKRAVRPSGLVLASLLVLSAWRVPAAEEKRPAPARPLKLAVMISIDGLSWQRLAAYQPWYVGGLKRLLTEGRVETEARYRHLNTETGPGHAALGTGAPPRVTGIVANRWFLQVGSRMQVTYCTDQSMPAGDEPDVVMPGPANLRVPTLGDELVKARPAARVVSVSGKDRGSIFMAGRDPRHAVYWYEHETGQFATSAAYDTQGETGRAAAAVVRKFNRKMAGGMIPGRFGLTWKKLPVPPRAPSDPPLPQAVPGIEHNQIAAVGLGWDHDLTKSTAGYFEGVYVSPVLDELTMDLTLALLADTTLELGHGETADLLCVSLSAQDTVSHNYGNESEEELDTLRRVDLQLGRLLDALDRTFPRGTVLLGLSADHGFSPIPEVERKRDRTYGGGRLVQTRDIQNGYIDRMNRLVTETLCLDPESRPVWGSEGLYLYYNRPALPLSTVPGTCGPAGRPVGAPELDAAVPKAIRTLFFEEVAEVLLVSGKDRWPAESPTASFAREDLDAERSGDLVVIPRPGVLLHWDPVRGSTHGTHYEDNIHVPLLFWGAGVAAGAVASPSTPYDLAPTIARALGVPLPSATGSARPLR